MRTDIRKPINPYGDGRRASSGLVSFAMLAIGIPWGILTLFLYMAGGDSQAVSLSLAGGWFVVLAFAYLGLHGLRALAWCSIPVLLTLRALMEFVAVPAWRFASGADQVDSIYVHSMILTLIGFAALWFGSLIFMRENELRFVPQARDTSLRIAFASAAMFIVGLVAKLVMWKAGLLSYTAQTGARESLIAYMELFVFLGNLLTAAMVISAIEVFGKRSTTPFIKAIFWLSILFAAGFGAISGMKNQFLQPLIILVLIYCITKRRIPRAAFLLPVLLVAIYPIFNAYRANLNNGYRSQANTVGGLVSVLSKTITDVANSPLSTSEQATGGLDRSTNRLSLLAYVHDIIGLPAPSLLNGDEKVWLAPVYPLIPRFLWKDKPILNKGQRLSVALGRPDTTSSALTPIADLYMLYATPGVVVGMFTYGICLQLYMNWICRRVLSERVLLVYLLLLLPLINLENDVVGLVAGTVQTSIIAVIVSYAIYGGQHSSSRFVRNPRLMKA
jgi:hypothetical protein